MSNLIQQKTTFATDAQHASTPHQQSPQEALVKGLAHLLRTPEAANLCRLVTADYGKAPHIRHWPRISKARQSSGLCNRGSRCLGRAGNPTLNLRSGSGHSLSC
jgi:hypothetical protein